MDKQNNSKLKNLSLNNEFEKIPTIERNLCKNLKTGGSINVINKEMLNDLIKHKLVKRQVQLNNLVFRQLMMK